MPGLFGAYQGSIPDDGNSVCQNMASAMRHSDRDVTDQYFDPAEKIILGRVSLGTFCPVPQPVLSEDGSCLIFFHGELYHFNESISIPEYLLKLYRQKGDQCAENLSGIFHFVIFDKGRNQLKLFSDKFGLQPLYYSLCNNGIVFAAEVKSVLQFPQINKTPDYQGIADYFHFGQILGRKTLFEG